MGGQGKGLLVAVEVAAGDGVEALEHVEVDEGGRQTD